MAAFEPELHVVPPMKPAHVILDLVGAIEISGILVVDADAEGRYSSARVTYRRQPVYAGRQIRSEPLKPKAVAKGTPFNSPGLFWLW